MMPPRRLLIATLALPVALSLLAPSADAQSRRRAVSYGAYPAFDCGSAPRTWNFDGRFGPNTVDAVKAYQRDHGLVPDGAVGPETAWALRITYRVVMKCGMAGPDILELQKALHREGYWYGGQGKGRPGTAEPTHEPTARPTARPTMRPTMRPTPAPTFRPTPTPAPELPEDVLPEDLPPDPEDAAPTPAPVATPLPDVDVMLPPDIQNMPFIELRGGTWMIPTTGSWFFTPTGATGFNSDFSLLRQNLNAEAAIWFGIAGLSGAVQRFELTGAPFSLGAVGNAGALMYDADLNFRFADGFYRVSAGYRGLNQNNINFATLGARLERPLAGDWLWWNAGLKGGSSLSGAWFYDGSLGLGLRFGLLGFDLGVRQLGLNDGFNPTATLNGPTVGAVLKF